MAEKTGINHQYPNNTTAEMKATDSRQTDRRTETLVPGDFSGCRLTVDGTL